MKKLTIILALLAAPAAAQNMSSGNQLHEQCTGKGEMVGGLCVGYILGAWEGLIIGAVVTDMQRGTAKTPNDQANHTRARLGICTTDSVLRDQIVDIVTQYLKNNPATRHFPAAGIVHAAMQDAFPC
ncbi:Rap1a/Tai family immunity protein [Sulfitobacter dubius]|uniref:Rap1a/Tai family immunity protein n=1 Tax=Sulfitobacter dubius TaxID=218673 RepID=UPI003B8A6C63